MQLENTLYQFGQINKIKTKTITLASYFEAGG